MFVTSDQNHDDYFRDVVHNSMNFLDISVGLVGESLENINEHTNGRRDTGLRIIFSKMMFIWMRWRSLVLILMEKPRSILLSQVYRKRFEQFSLNYNKDKRLYGLAELLRRLVGAEGIIQQNVHVNIVEKGPSKSKDSGKRRHNYRTTLLAKSWSLRV